MIDPIKLGKAVELSMESWNDGYRKGVEDAAKVAEARCQCAHHISIAYEIRALLDGGKNTKTSQTEGEQ